jgi:hypothetical protein
MKRATTTITGPRVRSWSRAQSTRSRERGPRATHPTDRGPKAVPSSHAALSPSAAPRIATNTTTPIDSWPSAARMAAVMTAVSPGTIGSTASAETMPSTSA